MLPRPVGGACERAYGRNATVDVAVYRAFRPEPRARWLDAFQAALDRDYPGIGAAVTERLFLNACSMQGVLNMPDGAVYGFAPMPPKRGIWAGIRQSPRTPVAHVYLASSFAGSGGFIGAMSSGADAARVAIMA
jgi:phytoene dehydrogenase-like protein